MPHRGLWQGWEQGDEQGLETWAPALKPSLLRGPRHRPHTPVQLSFLPGAGGSDPGPRWGHEEGKHGTRRVAPVRAWQPVLGRERHPKGVQEFRQLRGASALWAPVHKPHTFPIPAWPASAQGHTSDLHMDPGPVHNLTLDRGCPGAPHWRPPGLGSPPSCLPHGSSSWPSIWRRRGPQPVHLDRPLGRMTSGFCSSGGQGKRPPLGSQVGPGAHPSAAAAHSAARPGDTLEGTGGQDHTHSQDSRTKDHPLALQRAPCLSAHGQCRPPAFPSAWPSPPRGAPGGWGRWPPLDFAQQKKRHRTSSPGS